MRGRLSSVLFVFVAALSGPTYLACQLVDPESDLDGDGDGGSTLVDGALVDGAPVDATHPGDATGDVTAGDAGNADALGDSAPGDGAVNDAAPFCQGVDAFVCDGFDVDGPLNATTVTHVAGQDCDLSMGTIDVAGGRLTIDYQLNDGNSTAVCALDTSASGNVTGFRLDYDFAYQVDGDYTDAEAHQFAEISTVRVEFASGQANDAGIESIAFQVLLDAAGEAQFIALPYYPDASKSPQPGNQFPTFQLCNRYVVPWIPPGVSCHVSLVANTVDIAGTATATCGNTVTSMTKDPQVPPAGISAPATVVLGYGQVGGNGERPEWSLSYDNLLFGTTP